MRDRQEPTEPVLMPPKPARFNRRTRWLLGEHREALGSPAVYVEVGCFECSTLLWVMDNMGPQLAFGIDPYLGWSTGHSGPECYETAMARVREHPMAGSIRLMREESLEALRTWLERGLPQPDMMLVDGLHTAPESLCDLLLAWNLLQPGGVLVADDVHLFEKSRRWRREPMSKEAWQAFASCHEGRFETIFAVEHQVAIKKLR